MNNIVTVLFLVGLVLLISSSIYFFFRNHQTEKLLNHARLRLHKIKDVEQRYSGVVDIESVIHDLHEQKDKLLADITASRSQFSQFQAEIERKKEVMCQEQLEDIKQLHQKICEQRKELGLMIETTEFAEFAVYDNKYDFENSAMYRQRLDEIREKQKVAIKQGKAAFCHEEWVVSGSAKKGEKMTKDNLKMMIRAFNGETDAAIVKVNSKNIAVLEARINKAFEAINRINKVNCCELSTEYLQLRLSELHLFHEYQQKKRNELEEQQQIKAQMREEKLASQEIEQAQKHADKQEQFYKDELERVRHKLHDASQARQDEFEKSIAELEAKLANASMEKQRTLARAQLTRSGHVYVISNIGSFGEHVYKIGMTRRLEPLDRVKELGDASVPFVFDVHAMIYADDAPTLESELDRRFSEQRLNLVNQRKEFFRVSLGEIAEVVRELHGEIEFSLIADANEYRQTMARRGQAANQAPSTVQPISPPQIPPENMGIAAGY